MAIGDCSPRVQDESSEKVNFRAIGRVSTFLILVILVGLAIWKFHEVNQLIRKFLTWMEAHQVLGGFLYVAVYGLATVCLFPGSIMTIAAGYVFRWLGIPLTVAGATLGMAATFLIARYTARERVQYWVDSNPKFTVVDEMVAREGMKIVLLLRLAPIVPFILLNYVLGLTSISFTASMASSIIGIIPGTALFVYFGIMAGSLAEIFAGESGPGRMTKIGTLVLSGVVILVLVVYITVKAKEALRRAERDAAYNESSDQ